MEDNLLNAKMRMDTGKGVARKLRANGEIPAIAYGPNAEKNLTLSLPNHETVKLIRKPGGTISPFNLVVDGTTHRALLQNWQVHPVSRLLLHVDILLITEDAEVKVAIPVRTTGVSIGEKAGSRLVIARREVLVSCLPKDIPLELVVDVTDMEATDVRYVNELVFPDNVVPIFRDRYPVIVVAKAKGDALDDETEAEGEGEEEGEEEEAAAE